METARSTPLEYLVFSLKPVAPDAIRSPHYIAARAGKDSALEFITDEGDSSGSKTALQQLAESVVEDVHFRYLAHLAKETTPTDYDRLYQDVAFSFTPPYAVRVRGNFRDATFSLDEESQTRFILYVFNAFRKWGEKNKKP